MWRLRRPTVVVSGGFDPIHVGHIRNIEEAAALGRVIIVMARDDQLIKKKGYVFMPELERKEILEHIKNVDQVILSLDSDITSDFTLGMLKPDFFAKGGDRDSENMPQVEIDTCKRIGCEIVYGVGGGKVQSSSSLVDKARDAM